MIQELIGKTFVEVLRIGDESIDFKTADGEHWRMSHEQDCCETVEIEDVVGDLADLACSPIVMAEESTSAEEPKDGFGDSHTWTFYKFATAKGYVTIRWYGSSNGYYSETATFARVSDGR